FDSWVIAGSRCAPPLAPHHLPRIWRNQGWISPVLLVNGRIAGVWRHERKGRRLVVALEPFDGLPSWAEDQLAAEAARLATFFDCRLDLGRST
ncbi:MAG TPA: crosslink repair DNA glycosylase YcaQ family protein, partial [Thermomicrobiales bacterium]|nr:crosslink repair DNA glycosylase YcaQ family protein [Thermomicrobiales bacterium]